MAAFAQGSKLIQSGLDKAATGPYGSKGPVSPDALPLLVGNFINIAFDLLGIVLLAYLLWGGYTWLTAAGETKKTQEAKDIIKNAIIGIIIIVTANVIAGYVIGQLSTVTGSVTGG